MTPQPLALGYMRTNGGLDAAPLTTPQAEARRAAIEDHAKRESLALQDVYVEDQPSSQRAFYQLMGAVEFHRTTDERQPVVIIFESSDLGATTTTQAQARERIEDLGIRIEVIG